ncbi:MAG: replication initiation protein [Fusobacteriaceae bacterium]
MQLAIHREINRLSIHFENEILINCFIGILKEFNHFSNNGIIEFNKKELWKIANIKGQYREETIQMLIKELTKSSTYEVKDENLKLHGSIFIIAQKEESLKIEIPQLFQPYIFTKLDKDIILKNDKKEKLTTKELDYWDNTLRKKAKELVLIEEAEVLGVKGKYAKRLFMLLKPFSLTGYFVMSIEQFRDVMEVPDSWALALMNRNIVGRAKTELTNKGIFKFIEDEKKKKGRQKIVKIEIKFASTKTKTVKEQMKDVVRSKKNMQNTSNVEVISNIVTQELEKFSTDILEFREEAKKLGKKMPQKRYFEFLGKLIPLRTVEGIENLCREFQLI